MAKLLNIKLSSQSEIQKDHLKDENALDLTVGRRRNVDFFIPKLDDIGPDDLQAAPRVQQVVDQINQYIDNIADDYFSLGLHLIALHKLLKKSGLHTEQVKGWYTENINMPYSSAMQCKKVAEVYADHPELINRYTASGAYLLTSCETHEEREQIWSSAKGKKATASIRDLREALRDYKDQAMLDHTEIEEEHRILADAVPAYQFSEQQVHESLRQLTTYCETLLQTQNLEERLEMRQALIQATKDLLQKMESVLPSTKGNL